MLIGGEGLEGRIGECDGTTRVEGDVGEIVLKECKCVAVNHTTHGHFHVGSFDMELFHDVDAMIKDLVDGLGLEAIAEHQLAVVECLEIAHTRTKVHQEYGMLKAALEQHIVGQDGVLAVDIDAGDGQFESGDYRCWCRIYYIGFEQRHMDMIDARTEVGVGYHTKILAIADRVVKMLGNPDTMLGGNHESHLTQSKSGYVVLGKEVFQRLSQFAKRTVETELHIGIGEQFVLQGG